MRAAAVAVARELERRRPDLITAAWWKEERGERVFIDFNQNAPHKTVFGAWSVRARPGGAGVDAVPLGRARRRSTPTSCTIADACRRASRPTATRGPAMTASRSRSSRCSSCTSATCAAGPDGRALAARVPEDAERAAARGAVARAQARSRTPNPTFGQWCGPATRATMDWL